MTADIRDIYAPTTADISGVRDPVTYVPDTVFTTGPLALCICWVFGICLKSLKINNFGGML